MVQEDADGLAAFIREPAAGGRANDTLITLLASYIDVAKTKVRIVRGVDICPYNNGYENRRKSFNFR